MTATEIGFAVVLAAAVAGCVLGLGERIVVFRNCDDLGLVFLATVPLFMGFVSAIAWIFWPAAIACVAIMGWLAVRSWQDNRSVWKVALALPTQWLLSVLFIAFVWDLLAPRGSSGAARTRQRGVAAGVLAVLTPLLYRLVREQTGVLVPRDVLRKTRRGLTHGA